MSGVDPAAVVGDLDAGLPAVVDGPEPNRAFGVLASGGAHVGWLDPVVDGVAYQMSQRVLDRLDDDPVEGGLVALHFDSDSFACRGREVPDHTREPVTEAAERLHAGFHDLVLQRGGDEIQPLGDADEGRVGLVADALNDLVASQHQLPDEVEQRVEQYDTHTERSVGDPVPPVVGRAGSLRGGLGRGGLLRRVGRDVRGAVDLAAGAARAGGMQRIEIGERPSQRCHVLVPLATRFLDRSEDLADRVGHREESCRDLGVGPKQPVAQMTQQVLAGVTQRLESGEFEKATGGLERVDGPEDVGEPRLVFGVLLQVDEGAVETVEVLVALDQELLDRFGQGPHVEAIRRKVGARYRDRGA